MMVSVWNLNTRHKVMDVNTNSLNWNNLKEQKTMRNTSSAIREASDRETAKKKNANMSTQNPFLKSFIWHWSKGWTSDAREIIDKFDKKQDSTNTTKKLKLLSMYKRK